MVDLWSLVGRDLSVVGYEFGVHVVLRKVVDGRQSVKRNRDEMCCGVDSDRCLGCEGMVDGGR